jgi:membrane-bound lytic murein transglycosylase B
MITCMGKPLCAGAPRVRLGRLGALLMCLLALKAAAEPLDMQAAAVQQFINDTVTKTHLDRQYISDTLKQADTKTSIIDAMDRPAEKTKAWFEYRSVFVTDKRIRDGIEFAKEHASQLTEIENRTGVAKEVIVAIVGVETGYGQNMGKYRVLDSLSTLTFNYPARSSYFKSELQEFLLLCKENNIDPTVVLGSYAGAMGAPQFMPHSYRALATDGDHDGRIDLWNSWADIFESVAHYFVVSGWHPHESIVLTASLDNPAVSDLPANQLDSPQSLGALKRKGVRVESNYSDATQGYFLALRQADHMDYAVGLHNFYVITRYNRSPFYALAVTQIAQAIAQAIAPANTSPNPNGMASPAHASSTTH